MRARGSRTPPYHSSASLAYAKGTTLVDSAYSCREDGSVGMSTCCASMRSYVQIPEPKKIAGVAELACNPPAGGDGQGDRSTPRACYHKPSCGSVRDTVSGERRRVKKQDSQCPPHTQACTTTCTCTHIMFIHSYTHILKSSKRKKKSTSFLPDVAEAGGLLRAQGQHDLQSKPPKH